MFQPLVYPRYKQHVAKPGLERRGAWEKGVGEGVPESPEPHLVNGALLVEEIQYPPHLVAVGSREVQPCQGWFHALYYLM